MVQAGVRFVVIVGLAAHVVRALAVLQKLLLEHIVVVVQHDVIVVHAKLIIQPVGVQLREFVELVVLV